MKLVLGIDEVGRGCWAGPLVAGAVVLRQPIPGLRDSKKLRPGQRAQLAQLVHAQAAGVGLGWVAASELDSIGLTAAVRLAMQRAVMHVNTAYSHIVIDGSFNFLLGDPMVSNASVTTIIQADDTVPAVSAASIIAKVARDTYMNQQAAEYPDYGFDKHVGYGTALHQAALHAHGPCVLHRRSFKPVQAALAGTHP